jgi:hypothetical protein
MCKRFCQIDRIVWDKDLVEYLISVNFRTTQPKTHRLTSLNTHSNT